MSIYDKLLNVRKATGYLQKTENGNQGAKYVDPAVLVEKIRNHMNDQGLLLFPALSDSTIDQIPMPTKNNPNAMGFLFKSTVAYTFVDAESGEKLEVPWFMTGKHAQDPSMAGGGALTYFERYFLLKFFQIPTSKDDPEYFANKTREPEPPKKITIGEANINWMVAFCKKNKINTHDDKKAFMAHYGFDVYSTLPADFEAIKAKIEADYNEV